MIEKLRMRDRGEGVASMGVCRCYRRSSLEVRGVAVSLDTLFRSKRRRSRRVSPVANIKSQKKRNLTNAKRAERNKAVKSELKTRTKRATATVGSDEHDEAVRLAVKRLDMAAAKGVIHKNQAARRKS